MAPRKRVKMEFGEKQTSMPPSKKHRCLKFARDQTVGVVQKLSTADIRALAARNSTTRIRLLGAEVNAGLVDSPASVVAEVEDGENLLASVRRLEVTVSGSEATNSHLRADVTTLKNEVADLKRERVAVSLIVDEGYAVSARAFCDFIVNHFYKLAGKGTLDVVERRKWLDGSGAINFVKAGRFMKLFGNRIKIDANLLLIVKKLRGVSNDSSRTKCHNFKLVQVAFALKRLATAK